MQGTHPDAIQAGFTCILRGRDMSQQAIIASRIGRGLRTRSVPSLLESPSSRLCELSSPHPRRLMHVVSPLHPCQNARVLSAPRSAGSTRSHNMMMQQANTAAPQVMMMQTQPAIYRRPSNASDEISESITSSVLEAQAWETLRIRFQCALLSRYHCTVGAWRELDPRRHGRISFCDFCRVCQQMGYERETRRLWEALDEDRDGFIGFEDIDHEAAELLQDFATQVVAVHGSAESVWDKFFSKRGCGRVPHLVFTRACLNAGFSGDSSEVYRILNADRIGVSYRDFAMLDRWFLFRPTSPTASFGAPTTWDYSTLRSGIIACR